MRGVTATRRKTSGSSRRTQAGQGMVGSGTLGPARTGPRSAWPGTFGMGIGAARDRAWFRAFSMGMGMGMGVARGRV